MTHSSVRSQLAVESEKLKWRLTLDQVRRCWNPTWYKTLLEFFPPSKLRCETDERLSRDCNSIYRKRDRVDWRNSAFWQILRSKTKLFGIMQSARWESCSDFWLVNKNLDGGAVSVSVKKIFHVFLSLSDLRVFTRRTCEDNFAFCVELIVKHRRCN